MWLLVHVIWYVRFGGSSGAPPASEAAVKALRTFTVSDATPIPTDVDLEVAGAGGPIVAVPASFGPKAPVEGVTGRLVDLATPAAPAPGSVCDVRVVGQG